MGSLLLTCESTIVVAVDKNDDVLTGIQAGDHHHF
jgi:hypothetical protein